MVGPVRHREVQLQIARLLVMVVSWCCWVADGGAVLLGNWVADGGAGFLGNNCRLPNAF